VSLPVVGPWSVDPAALSCTTASTRAHPVETKGATVGRERIAWPQTDPFVYRWWTRPPPLGRERVTEVTVKQHILRVDLWGNTCSLCQLGSAALRAADSEPIARGLRRDEIFGPSREPVSVQCRRQETLRSSSSRRLRIRPSSQYRPTCVSRSRFATHWEHSPSARHVPVTFAIFLGTLH
jgi:hypothetical protein